MSSLRTALIAAIRAAPDDDAPRLICADWLEEQGGEAIGVVNLDSVPSAQALETVRQHPHILSLSVIKLPPMGDQPRWLES